MGSEQIYQQTLDYLYSFVDFSLLHQPQITPDHFNLDRMRTFASLLGDPQKAYPVLHVAGTKGKGSVSALCASALCAAGYTVGLYTSPHLDDYAERIQVDGAPIPHADLVNLVEELKPLIVQVPDLSTFEITTALAFLYFARREVDVAVIEVGLGGRLDATNAADGAVAGITSVSLEDIGEFLLIPEIFDPSQGKMRFEFPDFSSESEGFNFHFNQCCQLLKKGKAFQLTIDHRWIPTV